MQIAKSTKRAKWFLGNSKAVLSGLFICMIIAIISHLIVHSFGGPIFLFALLLGMPLHFLCKKPKYNAGIEFSSKRLLRLGVALLGARITFDQISVLGFYPLLLVTLSVFFTIGCGFLLARLLGVSKELGGLTGGAVAICGASAALALSATMPQHKTSEHNTILTVVGVTTLSTIAMIFYPIIVKLFHFTDMQAGLLLGATIHDVAQVIGAGYMVSQEAGDVATIVKLLRVAALVPVIMIFLYIFRQKHGSEGHQKVPGLPLFLLGFIFLVVMGSFDLIPQTIHALFVKLSEWLLVIAIAALGVKTSFRKLAIVGWKPIILMVLETLLLLVLVLTILVFMP